MSSYKVDAKTQLPVLYLKDQKNALWEKFSATYPDGMKCTSFMARLQNGRFKYQEDLGGLCLTCNDYGYQPIENLIELVNMNFSDKILRVSQIITSFIIKLVINYNYISYIGYFDSQIRAFTSSSKARL
jgi:hypothetical protein